MLLVLKRTVLMSGSFEHPKHMVLLSGEKIISFTLKMFVYLNPYSEVCYKRTEL